MDLSLQIQQKQILSQRMQQSVEILQMNTLALSEYIREVAEENPLLDWSEERPLLPEDEKLLQKLEWLQESDEQNRGFYQTEMDNEKEREDLRYGKKEAQSLREYLLFQIHLLPVCEKEKKDTDISGGKHGRKRLSGNRRPGSSYGALPSGYAAGRGNIGTFAET